MANLFLLECVFMRLGILIFGVLMGWLTLPVAAAADAEARFIPLDSMISLIRLLVQEGALSKDKAEALIRETERSAKMRSSAPRDADTVRVPYVPEVVKREIREEIKQEVLSQAKTEQWGNPGTLPDWVSRLHWEGDVRLRYQRDSFQSTNAPIGVLQLNGIGVNNSTVDQDRFRLRGRFGVEAKISDSLSAGVRLSTGNTLNPVSTNQTLGNYNNRYATVIDLAYLKFEPHPSLSLSGGRIPNPWFGTDLVWAPDLTFEGFAASFKPKFDKSSNGFFTAGLFPLQYIETSSANLARSKWLAGLQGGLEWALFRETTAKVGLGYYQYRNVEGLRNPLLGSQVYDQTAAQFRQKGNSLFNVANELDPNVVIFGLASKFSELNLTGSLDIATYAPVHIVLTGDYVKNLGFNAADIQTRTGLRIEPKTVGYHARIAVGTPNFDKRNNWQVYAAYKYLERDAVLDAFTDPDFRLGGTDSKGYILGASYAVDKNAWLTARWLSANQISGLPFAVDVLQVDMNVRF